MSTAIMYYIEKLYKYIKTKLSSTKNKKKKDYIY